MNWFAKHGEDAPSRQMYLSGLLAIQDIKHSYKRSAIGPLWTTLSMAIQITTMAVVFSLIFRIELEEYFPWLAASMLIWNFFATAITEGSNSLIRAEDFIKQIRISPTVYLLRSLQKSIILFGHNVLILPLVYLLFFRDYRPEMILVIPGLILLIGNLMWITVIIGFACARYRDLGPIIGSTLTILYFVTPIMWKPENLGNGELAHLLLGLNPVYHLLQVVRQPLVGELPTLENWLAGASLLVIGGVAAAVTYVKFRNKVAYWI
jgi:lipopolysaccharide transport system permease protein